MDALMLFGALSIFLTPLIMAPLIACVVSHDVAQCTRLAPRSAAVIGIFAAPIPLCITAIVISISTGQSAGLGNFFSNSFVLLIVLLFVILPAYSFAHKGAKDRSVSK
jgi:hypothetical protein